VNYSFDVFLYFLQFNAYKMVTLLVFRLSTIE